MVYLQKIGTTFYLRLPIPKDLYLFFPAKIIKKSLHTKSRKDAKQMLVKLVAEYQQKFFQLRYSPPMRQRPPTKLALQIFSKMYPGFPPEPRQMFNVFDRLITTWPLQLMSIMDALEEGYLPNNDGLLDCTNLPPRTEPMFREPEPRPAPQRLLLKPKLLYKAIEEYLKLSESGTTAIAALKPNTIYGYKTALEAFSAFAGINCDVATAATKITEYRDFRLDKDTSKSVGKTAINTYLRAINSFFGWCSEHKQKYIETLPAIEYCTFLPSELLDKGNKQYSDEDIQTILEALTHLQPKDMNVRRRNLSFVYFCLTLLFTGFRKEEALALDCVDFRPIEKIPVLDLPIAKIKLYKGLNAARVMPVHNKLLDLHLDDFVKSMKTERIFIYSYAVYRKLFNDILYSKGIKTKPYEQLFHSLRGGFDTSLNTLGPQHIHESHRLMLMGHGKKGQDNNYLNIVNRHVPEFNKSVQKMHFDYDFNNLKAFLRAELDYFKK